eukprot:TRINITY_DN76670_c0_g1_i1.p1 TRINITY_DN76670_c0_g1~~TRINITY_DN76670_c0_g1_i1.p1  ORF type:complete len:343 (-),score=15.13 TRINITY_DN76670_c0_g1_i1:141-1169(-)
MFFDGAALWGWLQMQVNSLQAGDALSVQERTFDSAVFLRRGKRYDASISIDNVSSHGEKFPTCSLTLKVLRAHKSKGRRRSKSQLRPQKASEHVPNDIRHTLNYTKLSSMDLDMSGCLELTVASAGRDSTLLGMRDAAEVLYRAVLQNHWTEWADWWHEFRTCFEVTPCKVVSGCFSGQIETNQAGQDVVSTSITLDNSSPVFQSLKAGVLSPSGQAQLAVRSSDETGESMTSKLGTQICAKGSIELMITCSDSMLAADAMMEAAESFCRPVFNDRWVEWAVWWNHVYSLLVEFEQFEHVEGPFACSLSMTASGRYVLFTRILLNDDTLFPVVRRRNCLEAL